MALEISHSVGKGGKNNPSDVTAVKRRLGELGFEFFPINEKPDQGLVMSIRLFQSIIRGSSRVGGCSTLPLCGENRETFGNLAKLG